MERLFTELTPEVDYTAQMYAQGDEKQEIATKKIKAYCTINNQLMKAYEVLGVRNRSELTLAYARRLAIKRARVMITKIKSNSHSIKISSAVMLLIGILGIEMCCQTSEYFRGSRRIELSERVRRVNRKDEYEPLIS